MLITNSAGTLKQLKISMAKEVNASTMNRIMYKTKLKKKGKMTKI